MAETKAKRASVEERLRLLYRLQLIDTKLAEIEALKGELPLEVRDLQDEIMGLEKRLEKLQEEKQRIEKEMSYERNRKEEIKLLLDRLQEQLKQARTSREYGALEKEIETQQLEIQVIDKRLHELQQELAVIEERIRQTEEKLQEARKRLEEKQKELDRIIAETEKEEQYLLKLRQEAVEKVTAIDERLYQAYERIRNKYKNRKAVVTFERDSCGGCYMWVPPQRQLEVRQRDVIYTCENCGRVFIDQELADSVAKELEEILTRQIQLY